MIKNSLDINETALTLSRLSAIFFGSFNVFDKSNLQHVYYFSVLAEIIIHMRDITKKVELSGGKIMIDVTDSGFESFNDLIKFFRDAVCHNDSPNRRIGNNRIYSHNIFASKYYPDEITIETGIKNLHLKRQLYPSYLFSILHFRQFPVFSENFHFKILIDYCDQFQIFDYLDLLERKTDIPANHDNRC